MAQIWKPQPKEVYQDWVNTIIDEASDELNNWENNFINDISARLFNGWQLTQAQAEKLESIYANRTK